MFNWRDYFTLAKNLSKSNYEASLRSSVSRAYYSAYCLAHNNAITLGFRPGKTAEEHERIVQFYSQNTSFPNLAQNLNRLRIRRNDCDYDNTVNGLAKIVKVSLLQCEVILKQLP